MLAIGSSLAILPVYFQRFIFRFLDWFRKREKNHAAYVDRTRQGFKDMFAGSKEEIDWILVGINDQFSIGFKQCLDLSDADMQDRVNEFTEFDRRTAET